MSAGRRMSGNTVQAATIAPAPRRTSPIARRWRERRALESHAPDFSEYTIFINFFSSESLKVNNFKPRFASALAYSPDAVQAGVARSPATRTDG